MTENKEMVVIASLIIAFVMFLAFLQRGHLDALKIEFIECMNNANDSKEENICISTYKVEAINVRGRR
jgi:hypothetical protein